MPQGSGEFLLWECPLAFWMEKEGYDVSYTSNVDTHADGRGLLRAKAWLSVGHDECWSLDMFRHVQAARDAGVSRFVAQSFASYRYAREGGPVKTEDDPLDPIPRHTDGRLVAARPGIDGAWTATCSAAVSATDTR